VPTRQCPRSMIAGVLLLASALGCRLLESGPNDEQVIAAVRKSLPSPPTLGPTYLAEVVSVQVEERGRYNPDGRYWPVRVRIKGATRLKVTNVFQLALSGDPRKQPATPADFVEEARLTKDDFGGWRVSYSYDPSGPRWRLEDRPAAPPFQR
jgi:hypothetical protein